MSNQPVWKEITDQSAGSTVKMLGAEEAPCEGEARLHALSKRDLESLLQTVDAIVWEGEDIGGEQTFHFTFVSRQAERILGYPVIEWLEQPAFWLDHIHPDDRQRVRIFYHQSIAAKRDFELECRMIAKGGQILWLRVTVKVVVIDDRRLKLRGIMVDITEYKSAEVALRESKRALWQSHKQIQYLAGKLIIAQEEERMRISRELHDDLNQNLAASAIAISKLKRELPESVDYLRDQLTDVQRRLIALSDGIRQLSHQLHPSILEHVGLVTALKSYCAEFGSHARIEVKLAIDDGIQGVPQNIALCLYRVTQESLHNIAKHSGVREAQVKLASTSDGISLSIADAGLGFDLDQAKRKGGLGLVSMEERIRLLRGSLQIKTQPHAGTLIKVQIPFSKDLDTSLGDAQKH
jgi:PAS domain S-box-containing protein